LTVALLASGGAALDVIEKNPVAFVSRIYQLSEEAATKVVNQYLKTDQPFRQQLAQIEQVDATVHQPDSKDFIFVDLDEFRLLFLSMR
jgi:type IV secretory pathway TrbF-like protein